jgi:hypothetical protein
MGDKKFYVYRARTTLEGLKQLNELKAKLNINWDKLINDAVCEKHGLDPTVINMPQSEFLQKREAKKAQKKAFSMPPAENKPQETSAEEQKEEPPAGKKKGGRKTANDKNLETVK